MAASEPQLVGAAKRGSTEALGVIFDRHWTTVWRAAYAVTRRRDVADDSAQDAFIRFAASLDRFDEQRPLAPWLVKIAVNRALEIVRAERRFDPFDESDPLGDDPGDEFVSGRGLEAVIARLQTERRVAIVLHFLLGFTLQETAVIVGVPEGTVASRVSRALGDLRQMLEVEERG